MKFTLTSILLICLLPHLSFAQVEGTSYEWVEKINKNGIKLFTSDVTSSPFKAVRGVMLVKGSINSLVALVEDLPACPQWAAMCEKARVINRISDSESYVYIYNNVPFPVSDRDVYAHVVWSVDAQTGRVSMNSSATAGGIDKTKAVRLTNAITQWHFTPQANGLVLVENFAHIDPNGPTPAWITNMLLVDAPYDSMFDMRKLIEGGAYQDAEIGFLRSQPNQPQADELLEKFTNTNKQ
jgi:hypothetical protein